MCALDKSAVWLGLLGFAELVRYLSVVLIRLTSELRVGVDVPKGCQL